MALVDIISTTYNDSFFLDNAFESVKNQRFKDYDWIVVNDASTDDTDPKLEAFKKKIPLKIITNTQNLHIAASANKAINISNGKYIARLDSDDTWAAEKLDLQVKFMEANPNIGVCGSFTAFYGNRNEIWKMPLTSDGLKTQLFFGSPFCNSSVLIRREVLEKNDLNYSLDYKYPPMEDYFLWWQLLNKTDFGMIDKVLTKKFERETSQTYLFEGEKQSLLKKLIEAVNQNYDFQLNSDQIKVLSQRKFDDFKTNFPLFTQIENKLVSEFGLNKLEVNKVIDKFRYKSILGNDVFTKMKQFKSFSNKKVWIKSLLNVN